ncbi:SLOG family protein [Flavilitoribacter nigricans]|nr:SLOG family protein [Flavilitoribacter nigricans]
MKLLITGSRAIAEIEANFTRLANEITSRYPNVSILLHGGARGADQLADRFARVHGLAVQVIRPDYQYYPEKLAPLMRNTELVELADAVVAFYGPKSKTGGTWDTVKKALAKNIPVTELFADGTVRHTPARLSLF